MVENKANNESVENESAVGKVLLEEFSKYRNIKNKVLTSFINFILILIPIAGIAYVLGLHQTLGLNIYREQYIGLFLGLVLCAIFLLIPARKRSSRNKIPWYDWILAALGLNAGFYIMIFYPEIILSMAYPTTARFVLSIIAIAIIFEAIRRLLGLAMLIIVSVFLAYGFIAPYLPGVLKGSKTPPEQLFNYLYLDPSSMLNLLNIAATIGLIFIFFGQVLLYFGGGDILNNIAMSLFGKYRGGPAKGAVVGSSMVGSITGSPVTNVILTGSVTIPLMKKNGYSATQAGAVESVASTGGQIMPPVLGIAAFIIAETLGIPYAEVALAAVIPAIMFYFCLFLQIDFIAGRDGIKRLNKADIPIFKKVISSGWMVIPPFVALIYFLFIQGSTPQTSGLYASVIAIIFLCFQKEMLKKFLKIIPALFVDTGKMMLEIGLVLGAAGIVVGVTGITGLGFNIGFILSTLAENGLLILLIMSALFSIVLGMGMPSVAAYALVAVLVAPTLVELGVTPLAAHLFVYFFAIMSNFTPPVAMSCFAAAPIAQANPHKIGFRAMKLGLVGYIVPFIFVYAPELLLSVSSEATWYSTALTIVTALIACYLLSMAVEGFLFQRLNIVKRIIAVAIAFCLFLPYSVWEYSWIVNNAAIVAAILFVLTEWQFHRKSKAAATSVTA